MNFNQIKVGTRYTLVDAKTNFSSRTLYDNFPTARSILVTAKRQTIIGTNKSDTVREIRGYVLDEIGDGTNPDGGREMTEWIKDEVLKGEHTVVQAEEDSIREKRKLDNIRTWTIEKTLADIQSFIPDDVSIEHSYGGKFTLSIDADNEHEALKALLRLVQLRPEVVDETRQQIIDNYDRNAIEAEIRNLQNRKSYFMSPEAREQKIKELQAKLEEIAG